jgi:hypothetical protein
MHDCDESAAAIKGRLLALETIVARALSHAPDRQAVLDEAEEALADVWAASPTLVGTMERREALPVHAAAAETLAAIRRNSR